MLPSSTPHAPIMPAVARSRAEPPRPQVDQSANVVAHLQRARTGLDAFRGSFPALAPAVRALSRLESRLQRPLRLAIVGEFNSGKSSLANLLVGIDSLPTAIVSNTRIPTLIYFAAEPEIHAVAADGKRSPIDAENPLRASNAVRLEVGLPSPRLKAMQVIDLPGLSDPRFDDAAADLQTHDIDAVLWCTVATQAWKESERSAWSQIPARLRERGIMAVTHRDLIVDPTDEAKLLARLRAMAGEEFRDIVMLSTAAGAEPALIALPPDEREAAREASDLAALERAIDRVLEGLRRSRCERAVEVVNRIGIAALTRIEPARQLVAAG